MKKDKNITSYEIHVITQTDFMREFLEKGLESCVAGLQEYLVQSGKTKSKIELIKSIIK